MNFLINYSSSFLLIPNKIRYEVFKFYNKLGQIKFYKYLYRVSLKNKLELKFNDTQRLIRFFEIFVYAKSFLKNWKYNFFYKKIFFFELY